MRVWTNSTDTDVADDMADAEAVWVEHNGCTHEEATGATFADEWGPVEPNQVITIRDDDGGRESKTAAEWADSNGRGFLCSTEY
jgi:hypothetical protein